MRTYFGQWSSVQPSHLRPHPLSASSSPFSPAIANASSSPAANTAARSVRLALEIDPENAPAHLLIARNFQGWIEAVRECLVEMKTSMPRAVLISTHWPLSFSSP